jgi:hypothetical protein
VKWGSRLVQVPVRSASEQRSWGTRIAPVLGIVTHIVHRALVCSSAAGISLAVLAALPSSAHADDWGTDGHDVPDPVPAKPATERSGVLTSVALHTLLAIGILSEDDVDQAALLMTGVDVAVGMGARIGKSSRLAYELALGVRSTLGVAERYSLRPGFDPAPPETLDGVATYVLPLGVCIDWLPDAPSGPFASAHLGVGTFSEPAFMTSGNLELAGRVALDLGWSWQLRPEAHEPGVLAVSARYSLLGMKRVYIDEDYNSGLQLHELSLGLAWHL